MRDWQNLYNEIQRGNGEFYEGLKVSNEEYKNSPAPIACPLLKPLFSNGHLPIGGRSHDGRGRQ